MMKLQADTGGNFLPLTFNNIHGTVFDLTTNRQVATGDTGHLTVPAKQFPVVSLNLNFTYAAVNDSDITCVSCFLHTPTLAHIMATNREQLVHRLQK